MRIVLVIVLYLVASVDSTCKEYDEDGIRQTCPLTPTQVSDLIDQIPEYKNDDPCYKREKCAREWMKKFNRALNRTTQLYSYSDFEYQTNQTDQNSKRVDKVTPLMSKLNKISFFTGKKFYKNSKSWPEELRRMFYLTRLVDVSQPEVTTMINKMTAIYSQTSVTKDGKAYRLVPELSMIMATSRQYDELLWAWTSWFNTVGPQLKPLYIQSVELENKYAREYGYKDLSENWIEELQTENLEALCESLYEQIQPFYEQLHAYVRRKLRAYYGSDKIKSKLIPAHLLGNMWAQSWNNIFDIVQPYKQESSLDITQALVKNRYTPLKMFKKAEEFFTSIGLYRMSPTFWKYSMFVRPKDRSVECLAQSFDFYNGFDYRVKMCTEVTGEDFIVAHQQIGFIEYSMSYANQPMIFAFPASSVFIQSIGMTIGLSVNTPTHLKKIGLLNDFKNTKEYKINYLLRVALDKVAFLPFSYRMDKWRWDVFRGKIKPNQYNEKWWETIEHYQGLESPVARGEQYFDAGGKFHIPGYVPYVRYYIATFLQFQFYDSLCELSGYKGPLYLCDFYGSKKAGGKFKDMMSLGSSKPWTVGLKILTGKSELKADGLLAYFDPLIDWLKEENAKYPDDPVGWED